MIIQALFHKQSGLQRYRADLAVSYMEIYKDEVYDLLVNRDNVSSLHPSTVFQLISVLRVPQAPKLPVRENDVGQVFVANLTTLPISSFSDFERIYL